MFKIANKQFLDRLAETNFDKTVLLVYTDWLEEFGDEEQAIAIRKSINNKIHSTLVTNDFVLWFEYKDIEVIPTYLNSARLFTIKHVIYDVYKYRTISNPGILKMCWTTLNRNRFNITLSKEEIRIYE